MRALLSFLAIVAVLLVGAVFLAPMLISADLVKREVEAAVQQATGRTLVIGGDVSISAWPSLAANIGEVTFSNAPGASTDQMAEMRELRAEIALLPLFSGEVQIAEFVLRDPVINLEVLPNGRPNWQFDPAPDATGAGPAPDTGPGEGAGSGMGPGEVAIADLRIENGRISYADRTTGAAYTFSDVDVSVSLPGLDEELTVDGGLVWNGERVTLDAAVAQPRVLMEGGATAATLDVASSPITLSYSGTAVFGDALSTDGSMSLDVPSVRGLAAWTGNPMTPGGGFGPLSLSGNVTSAGNRYSFTGAEVSLDGTNGTGEVTVITGGTRPKVTGTLAVDQIDTNVYTGQGDAGWSTEEIDFSGLSAIDADLDLAAGEIIFGNIVTGASSLDLGLDNGRLVAALTRLDLYGGAGSGTLTLNGRTATPSLAANFDLSGLAIDPFLTAAAGFERLRGTGALNIDVTASGGSQAQMVNTLNGTGAIDFRNGAIKGINLAQIIRTALTNPISGWSSAATKDTDFSELTGTFRVANGILTNNDLNMLGPLLRLTGAGSTSIAAQTIDYRLNPKLVASLEGQGGSQTAGLDVPIRVTGTWSSPRFAPDLAAVIEDPAKALQNLEGLQKLQPKDVIRGLLGQEQAPADPGGSGEETQAAPAQEERKSEDVIRGLFGR